MKTLIDGRCLKHPHVTGVERYVRELTDELTNQRVEFDLAKPAFRNRWAQQLWEHFKLSRLARRYDVLFCPANVTPIWVPRTAKLVVTIHCLRFLNFPEDYTPAFEAYYRLLIPRSIRRADAIITVSHAQAREIAERFPHTKDALHVTPLGISEEFQPPIEPCQEPVVLFVGNAGVSKNLPRMLEAFAAISDRIDHSLWIVGASRPTSTRKGSLSRALSQIGEDRIKWLGRIDDKTELVRTYQRAELLVFPSLYESFGLPPLEAMACGVPVLVSDIPAVRETVGDAGIFVDPYDVSALSEAMLEVLADRRLRERLSEKGLRRAANFSWKTCAAQTYKVLCEVV